MWNSSKSVSVHVALPLPLATSSALFPINTLRPHARALAALSVLRHYHSLLWSSLAACMPAHGSRPACASRTRRARARAHVYGLTKSSPGSASSPARRAPKRGRPRTSETHGASRRRVSSPTRRCRSDSLRVRRREGQEVSDHRRSGAPSTAQPTESAPQECANKIQRKHAQ